jgi:hypothetical protein
MSGGNKSADEPISDALLEKLRNCAAKPQETYDTIRSITAKIHARVTSSGNCNLLEARFERIANLARRFNSLPHGTRRC